MKKELRKGLRTWIEIDKKAIKNNFNSFKKLIPKSCKFLAVVKSNAYGHNLTEFSKEMEKLGADFLGVDSITEALALRREKIKIPILVLGYTLPERLEDAVNKKISISVSSFETISAIKKFFLLSSRMRGSRKLGMDSRLHGNDRRVLNIHIKVDTGMGRHGFLISDQDKLIRELKKLTMKNDKNHFVVGNINVEGLFTHFSSAKKPDDLQYTNIQIETFKKWIEIFKTNGFNPIIHTCATSGTILFSLPEKILIDGKSKIFRALDKKSNTSVKTLTGEALFDMVRIGIGLYGEWPSKEIKETFKDKINLLPVMSWKTIVGEIKKIPAGEKIGYDGTKVLEKDSIIAICPIGYWHGYPRALSNKGFVLIKGKEAKILGRVCMDIIIVDVSDIYGVKVGEEVVILGKSGNEIITPGNISDMIDGSDYELLTGINPLIKKFYI